MSLKRLLLKGADALLARAGIVVAPDWRACRLDEERHLRRLFRHLDIDCVFDVGANAGQYAQMLRQHVGFTGQIVSFEPNPAVHDRLRAAAAGDPKWHIETFALGRDKGMLDFHAYDISELGSLRALKCDETHTPRAPTGATVQVQVETLADYIAPTLQRLGVHRPFLKMDTQGFDVDVAAGAGHQLRTFLGLQSEVAFQTIYQGAPNWREAIDFYESKGFRLSRLVPIHELHFPDLVEMDAILVRT